MLCVKSLNITNLRIYALHISLKILDNIAYIVFR